jgi:hypothetical protein
MALCEEDVKLLRDYISKEFPKINAKLQDIDRKATDSVIRGLRVQGWSDADISEGRTGLTRMISDYLRSNTKPVESRIIHTVPTTLSTPPSTVENRVDSGFVALEKQAICPSQSLSRRCTFPYSRYH